MFKKGPPKKYGNTSRGGYGDRDYGDRPTMHKTTCSTCGDSCEVPFKPSGQKPIYCRQCFAKEGPMSDKPRMRPTMPSTREGAPPKPEFDILNDKLDRILKALQLLTAAKAPAKDFAPKRDFSEKRAYAPKRPYAPKTQKGDDDFSEFRRAPKKW